jgi:hypothetical protein
MNNGMRLSYWLRNAPSPSRTTTSAVDDTSAKKSGAGFKGERPADGPAAALACDGSVGTPRQKQLTEGYTICRYAGRLALGAFAIARIIRP